MSLRPAPGLFSAPLGCENVVAGAGADGSRQVSIQDRDYNVFYQSAHAACLIWMESGVSSKEVELVESGCWRMGPNCDCL